MTSRGRVAVVLIFIFGLHPDACICQDPPSRDGHGAGTHETHKPHQNHIAVFGGMTNNLEKKGSSPTIGLDFGRNFTIGRTSVGVGFFGEAIVGSHTEWLLGALFYYKPARALWFRRDQAWTS